MNRTYATADTLCPDGCGALLKSNQKYATDACRKRVERANGVVMTMPQCASCGGHWAEGKPGICSECVRRGERVARAPERRDPVLRVAPRAEGHPRLYYGFMNLSTLERDGIVEVFCGDAEVKPVLRAFAEVTGGIYQDDAIVLTVLVPIEALTRKVAAIGTAPREKIQRGAIWSVWESVYEQNASDRRGDEGKAKPPQAGVGSRKGATT